MLSDSDLQSLHLADDNAVNWLERTAMKVLVMVVQNVGSENKIRPCWRGGASYCSIFSTQKWHNHLIIALALTFHKFRIQLKVVTRDVHAPSHLPTISVVLCRPRRLKL